jgi:hypothetical protein
MEIASVEDLVTTCLAEDVVELATGKAVRVRSLSRADVVSMRALQGLEFERFVLSRGVSAPALTEDQAAAWLAAVGPDVIEPVMTRIVQLSRMTSDSQAAAYKSDSGES